MGEMITLASTVSTVHVVDDDAAICRSLKWLIESIGLPVRTYSSADEFLAALDPAQPGCLVLDIRMPGMNGLELQQHLLKNNIQIPIIIITGHGDVQMSVQAMKAGAVDFLQKPFSDQTLLDLIQESLRKDAASRAARAKHLDIARHFQRMTPREREVLVLVVSGSSTAEIARRLGVSQKTIEVHRANIMAKSNAGSLAELVRWAIAAGFDR